MKLQSIIIVSEKSDISDSEIQKILQKVYTNFNFDIRSFNSLNIVSELKSIGIADLKEVQQWTNLKSDTLKFLKIFSAQKLTPEAQNSLLKVVEETPENTLVILIANNLDNIIGTIKSRCIVIYNKSLPHENAEILTLSENFLHANLLERISIIDYINDKQPREFALEFIVQLIKLLHQNKAEYRKIDLLKELYIGVKRNVNLKLVLFIISYNI